MFLPVCVLVILLTSGTSLILYNEIVSSCNLVLDELISNCIHIQFHEAFCGSLLTHHMTQFWEMQDVTVMFHWSVQLCQHSSHTTECPPHPERQLGKFHKPISQCRQCPVTCGLLALSAVGLSTGISKELCIYQSTL